MHVHYLTGDVTGVMRACGNDVIAAHAVNSESCRFLYCFFECLLRIAAVALPPSGTARSQVDQGRRRGYHKMKLQNYHSATFKCTKMLIQPLQPSCDAQDAAICWQVDQMGHTSQQLRPFVCPLPTAASHRRRSCDWDLLLSLFARATDRLRPAIITLVNCRRKNHLG